MPIGKKVQVAPFPNIVIPGFGRTKCHIACINVAGGAATLVSTRSSQNVTVTDNGAGDFTVGFPAGGTGAIGFALVSVEVANNVDITASVSTSTAANFATGVITINSKTAATATDPTGNVVVAVFVVEDPNVSNG